jgi:hypothetical protein
MSETLIEWRGFALVPGPVEIDQPLYSFEVDDDIVLHLPEEVALALLAIPGMRRTNAAEPASGNWTARWEEGERYLDLDFTLMESNEGEFFWGGSNLRGRCTRADLLGCWSALNKRFEGVWLHGPDCRLYTPA